MGQAKTKHPRKSNPETNTKRHEPYSGGKGADAPACPPKSAPKGEGATEAPQTEEDACSHPTTQGLQARLPWHYEPQE